MDFSQHLIFAHKELNNYIVVDLINKTQDVASIDYDVEVFESKDGNTVGKVTSNYPGVSSIPKPLGNIIEYSLVIIRHFRKSGYRLKS
jgi:hypothetical protein